MIFVWSSSNKQDGWSQGDFKIPDNFRSVSLVPASTSIHSSGLEENGITWPTSIKWTYLVPKYLECGISLSPEETWSWTQRSSCASESRKKKGAQEKTKEGAIGGETCFPELIRSSLCCFSCCKSSWKLSYNRLSGKEKQEICIPVYYIKIWIKMPERKRTRSFRQLFTLKKRDID